ncbi:ribosome silencing factor [Micrococcus terreus]|uniref:ribosome silencing factor n=1 Tax=Micrococcus terreus TaxID=574650 RepID=UPI0023F94A04|nr:ribosome silencing factor [Micrococcus terreus]
MTVPQTTLTALTSAAHAALEKQAENILAVDVAERIGLTDAFLIASAPSERQVNAIVDEIEDVLREEHDLKPLRREGRAEGRWVLLDFGHFVVHVQHDEERAFYALDRLWKDSPLIDLELPEAVSAPTDQVGTTDQESAQA